MFLFLKVFSYIKSHHIVLAYSTERSELPCPHQLQRACKSPWSTELFLFYYFFLILSKGQNTQEVYVHRNLEKSKPKSRGISNPLKNLKVNESSFQYFDRKSWNNPKYQEVNLLWLHVNSLMVLPALFLLLLFLLRVFF